MKKLLLSFVVLSFYVAACTPDKADKTQKPASKEKKTKTVKKPEDPFKNLTPVEVGKHAKAALHVTYSPDGSLLASSGKDKLIKLWNPSSGQLVRDFKGHTDDVMMVNFSPDGKLLVSASKDKTARIWDVSSGKLLKTLSVKPPNEKKMSDEELVIYAATPPPLMNWATFSKDGKKVITAGDDFALRLWDVAKGKPEIVFSDPGCRQNRVYRRQDTSGWVSSAGCMDDGVSYLKFWDERGNLVNQQGDENHDAHFLAFDQSVSFIISADGSVSFSVYSGQGSYLKRIMVGAYHFCVAFGPEDKTLMVGGDFGVIYVYRPVSWKREGKLFVGTKSAVDCLAINPVDGTMAVALRDGKILRYTSPIK